jgi:hypothetical protein
VGERRHDRVGGQVHGSATGREGGRAHNKARSSATSVGGGALGRELNGSQVGVAGAAQRQCGIGQWFIGDAWWTRR